MSNTTTTTTTKTFTCKWALPNRNVLVMFPQNGGFAVVRYDAHNEPTIGEFFDTQADAEARGREIQNIAFNNSNAKAWNSSIFNV